MSCKGIKKMVGTFWDDIVLRVWPEWHWKVEESPGAPGEEPDWFQIARERVRVDEAWRKASYTKTFVRIHSGEVVMGMDADSRGEEYVVSGGQHEFLHLDVRDMKGAPLCTSNEPHSSWIKAIECKKDVIISGSSDQTAKVWRLDLSKREMNCTATLENGRGVVVLESRKNILSCGCAGILNIWDLNTKQLFYSHRPSFIRIEYLAMEDENVLYTGASDNLIRQYDLRVKECVKEFSHPSLLYGMKYDPIHKMIISCCTSQLNVWDLRTQSLRSSFDATPYGINALTYLPHQQLIVTGGSYLAAQKGIHVWNVEDGNPVAFGQPNEQHSGTISSLFADSQKVVSLGKDGFTKVWTRNNEEVVIKEKFEDAWASSVIVKDNHLVSTSATGTIMFLDFNPQQSTSFPSEIIDTCNIQ
eukprot:TRINITY_DN5070_c0_g1_i4.p1 TRINITY_DN5070_c0_g1~~TRINITY_DN5070_c0_g1_i4.p1  ORF type:complete len:442 (+),score=113.96 TRINITY_DN5070_c0_g1_i4:84-1328(+)